MKSWSAYPIRLLLTALCEKPECLSPQEMASAGTAARSLFEFALAQTPRDRALVRSGIETICRTYDSDPRASKTLLCHLLTQENLQEFGYEDMRTLAWEAERLLTIAPDFVHDIYFAAFSFKETSTDKTAMGASRILPLTSNRRQDYNHALWQLGETFPSFLRAAPTLAIEALTAAISAYVSESRLQAPTEQEFEFNGNPARIKPDGSHIWDGCTHYRHDPHLKMLDAFGAELQRVVNDTNLAHAENQLLTAVCEKTTLASVWRSVLECGTQNAAGFGKRIVNLACSLPILTGLDTSNLAGNFITAIYPHIQIEERGNIENAILSIPNLVAASRKDAAIEIRDRLLGCIPEQFISVEEARNIVSNLIAHGGPPANQPPCWIGSTVSTPYTNEQFLADQGVPIQTTANRRIIELTEPIRAFVTAHSQSAPTLAEIDSIIVSARALHTTLLNATTEGAHEMQIQNATVHLVSFCTCAARCETLDCSTDTGEFIRGILLASASHSNPIFDEHWATDFDTHTSWIPAPRIDGAEGLMFLASKPACINTDVIQEIVRLSKDPVPAVRLQIADYLGLLEVTLPQVSNELLCAMAEHDPSSSVVLSLLNRPIYRLVSAHPDEAESLTMKIFHRSDLKGEVATEVRLTCVSLCLRLFLSGDNAASEHLIQGFTNDVSTFTEESTRIVASIREVLVAVPISPEDLSSEKARTRAFQVFETITRSAQEGLSTLEKQYQRIPFYEWPETDKEKATQLTQIMDSIASQLYLASGAFENKQGQIDAYTVSLEQKRRFIIEASRILDLLSESPHPSTVHNLIQMLHSLIDVSPREVFLRMSRIVQAGKGGRYEMESLAIAEIVNVVNRMLADFRTLLQDDQEMRNAMVSILDTFVEAGWPQAIQLTYRLDEIYR